MVCAPNLPCRVLRRSPARSPRRSTRRARAFSRTCLCSAKARTAVPGRDAPVPSGTRIRPYYGGRRQAAAPDVALFRLCGPPMTRGLQRPDRRTWELLNVRRSVCASPSGGLDRVATRAASSKVVRLARAARSVAFECRVRSLGPRKCRSPDARPQPHSKLICVRGVAEPPLPPVMLGALADARWTESNFRTSA